MKTVKFNKWECNVQLSEHVGGHNALILRDINTDEVIIIASVNLKEMPMNIDEVAIKDYSENQGVLKALRKAGIVGKPVKWVRSGFVRIAICKILIVLLLYINIFIIF